MRLLFRDPTEFDAWAARWHSRLREEPSAAEERAAAMRRVNPAYIPRNHLVQQVIDAAVERAEYEPFRELVRVTAHPYEEAPETEAYAKPARPEQCVLQTFCGT